MSQPAADPRQHRRVTSGKKRRIVRSLRQQAEQHRTHLIYWPKVDAGRPGARVR